MNTLGAVFKLIRPSNGLLAIFSVLLYQVFVFNTIILDSKTALLAAIVFFALSGGNIINDIFDLSADKLNGRIDRPLVSGKLTKKQTQILYIFALVLSIGLSFFLTIEATLVVLLNSILLFYYSKSLKRQPLIGNITVSYLSASIFLFCWAVYSFFLMILLPALLAFFIHLLRELVKDLEDLAGDKKEKLQTFPIRFGVSATIRLMWMLNIPLLATLYLPLIQNRDLTWYTLSITTLVTLPLFYIMKIVSKQNKKSFSIASKLYKLLMFIGLLILIVFRNDIRYLF